MSTAAVGEANELNLGITFLDCADAALIAMRSPLLSDTWNDDSVLDRMTVGGLVAHISSAIITAELYLPVDAPTGTTATDAAGFYIEAMKIGDYREGPDSELQSMIRTGSEELAATGQSAVIATAEGSLERVRGLLDGHQIASSQRSPTSRYRHLTIWGRGSSSSWCTWMTSPPPCKGSTLPCPHRQPSTQHESSPKWQSVTTALALLCGHSLVPNDQRDHLPPFR